jgi:hypothetical protein
MFAQLLSIKVKIKVDLSTYSPLDIWGGARTAPIILNFGTRCRRVLSVTHWPLKPQGESHRYPLDRRLGELQSRYGLFGEKKNCPLA